MHHCNTWLMILCFFFCCVCFVYNCIYIKKTYLWFGFENNSFKIIVLILQDEILTNTTKSVLNFVPTTEDDGKSITCRAENPKITPAKFMETTWKLDVVCKYAYHRKSILNA